MRDGTLCNRPHGDSRFCQAAKDLNSCLEDSRAATNVIPKPTMLSNSEILEWGKRFTMDGEKIVSDDFDKRKSDKDFFDQQQSVDSKYPREFVANIKPGSIVGTILLYCTECREDNEGTPPGRPSKEDLRRGA
ncbi:hypothetical protein KM043_008502 [Ampulex compressa]|nr:hypothetical protein KM043_008502 [Ampulex compressa]